MAAQHNLYGNHPHISPLVKASMFNTDQYIVQNVNSFIQGLWRTGDLDLQAMSGKIKDAFALGYPIIINMDEDFFLKIFNTAIKTKLAFPRLDHTLLGPNGQVPEGPRALKPTNWTQCFEAVNASRGALAGAILIDAAATLRDCFAIPRELSKAFATPLAAALASQILSPSGLPHARQRLRAMFPTKTLRSWAYSQVMVKLQRRSNQLRQQRQISDADDCDKLVKYGNLSEGCDCLRTAVNVAEQLKRIAIDDFRTAEIQVKLCAARPDATPFLSGLKQLLLQDFAYWPSTSVGPQYGDFTTSVTSIIKAIERSSPEAMAAKQVGAMMGEAVGAAAVHRIQACHQELEQAGKTAAQHNSTHGGLGAVFGLA